MSCNTCKYFEYVKFKLKVYLFRFSTNTEKWAYLLFFFKYFLQIKCFLFHFIFIKKYWNLHICALGGVASKMQFCPIFHTFAKPWITNWLPNANSYTVQFFFLLKMKYCIFLCNFPKGTNMQTHGYKNSWNCKNNMWNLEKNVKISNLT